MFYLNIGFGSRVNHGKFGRNGPNKVLNPLSPPPQNGQTNSLAASKRIVGVCFTILWR